MSISAHLIHSCTILRKTTTGEDVLGNATEGESTAATGVACRLVEKTKRVWSDEKQESMVLTVYKLLTGPGTDLQNRDVVTNVVLEDGTTRSERFVVKSLLARRGRSLKHNSAELETIS